MPSYAVGDIQGCYAELKHLLSLFKFNPNSDKVYLVGDLVNRGPNSLDVLRFAYLHQSSVNLVLGNHDLHLLACWAGVTKVRQLDTFTETLMAPDIDDLMNWLRKQPLMLELSSHIIVHAGINPTISFEKLKSLAAFCQNKLSGDDYEFWLRNMYGSSPLVWAESLTEVEKFRYGINSLTRMRMFNNLEFDFKFKGQVDSAVGNLTPWFEFPTETLKQVAFGHWSALGLVLNQKMIALDTGCIWGGQLTAICLDDGSLFQSPALAAGCGIFE